LSKKVNRKELENNCSNFLLAKKASHKFLKSREKNLWEEFFPLQKRLSQRSPNSSQEIIEAKKKFLEKSLIRGDFHVD